MKGPCESKFNICPNFVLEGKFVLWVTKSKLCQEFVQVQNLLRVYQELTRIISLGGNKSKICPHIVQVQHLSRLCHRLNIRALSWLVTKPGNPNFVQSFSGDKICPEFVQDFTGTASLWVNKSKPCPHMVQVASLSRLCPKLTIVVSNRPRVD